MDSPLGEYDINVLVSSWYAPNGTDDYFQKLLKGNIELGGVLALVSESRMLLIFIHLIRTNFNIYISAIQSRIHLSMLTPNAPSPPRMVDVAAKL